MKCKKLDCENLATPGFEACSILHGADIKRYRKELAECFDADLERKAGMRGFYSISEAEHYL